MKFSGRMNSFMHQGYDLLETIEQYKKMNGITHLEFNYPEHIEGYDMDEILSHVGDMKVNGVATRFKNHFVAGEFCNPDAQVCSDAVTLCKEAADACRRLGGEVLTIWLGYDGFDYAFQMDYENKWNGMIRAFQEVADYASDLKVSIEYKPFEPRAYSMIDGIGLTMMAIQEINRPNVGVTLDFCHMLMKHESPAYSLVLAAKANKLFGLHMNDGYRMMDNGLIFGSVNLAQALEFVYYLKKYNYDGVMFFDSFPFRENAVAEVDANMQAFNQMAEAIDKIGMEAIAQIIHKQDGVSAQKLVLSLLK